MNEIIKLVKVVSRRQIADFHKVPYKIYKNDEQWIPHIKQDIEQIFDPKKNLQFSKGDAARWILTKKNEPIGRISAFVWEDRDYGGIGFFECLDNLDYAKKLLDKAENWIKDKGKTKVQGIVNFGERDKFWGLMVKGFKRPSYQENYNPPYYIPFFEKLGYKKIIEQNTSELHIENFDGDKFKKIAEKAYKIEGLEIKSFKKSALDDFVQDFHKIYNDAWKEHKHYVPLSVKRVHSLFHALKSIIREDVLLFAYVNSIPVGFYLSVIDVNQIFKKVNGNLNLLGKLKFLWHKNKIHVDRIRGIIFGVVPEYQGKGIAYALIYRQYDNLKRDPHIKSTELAWVGDFNPRMLKLFQKLGVQNTKTHFTLQKQL